MDYKTTHRSCLLLPGSTSRASIENIISSFKDDTATQNSLALNIIIRMA